MCNLKPIEKKLWFRKGIGHNRVLPSICYALAQTETKDILLYHDGLRMIVSLNDALGDDSVIASGQRK